MGSPTSFFEASEKLFVLFHGLFTLEYVFMYISLIELIEKWNFRQKIFAIAQEKKIARP